MRFKLPRVSIVTSDEDGSGYEGEFNTLSVGLGLHRAWTYLTLFCSTSIFTSPIVLSNDSSPINIGIFYLVCTLLTIVLLLCAGAFSSRERETPLDRRVVVIASVLCSVGTLILTFACHDGPVAFIVAIIAGICCGVSNGALIVLWGKSFAQYEILTIVINTAVSIFIALLLFAVLSKYAPQPWGNAITALLPLCEIPILRHHLEGHSGKSGESSQPTYLPTNKRLLCLKLGLPLLLFGFALGTVRYLTVDVVNVMSDELVFFLALMIAGIIMLILLVVLHYYSEFRSGESLMRYMIPILVVAIIFLPLPSMTSSVAAAPLLLTSYLSFKAIIWIFLCGTSQKFRLSPVFVVGIGFGSMAIGAFLSNIGLLVGESLRALTPFGENTLLALAVISMVIAFALLPRTADIAKLVEAPSGEAAMASPRTPMRPRRSASAQTAKVRPATADQRRSASSSHHAKANTMTETAEAPMAAACAPSIEPAAASSSNFGDSQSASAESVRVPVGPASVASPSPAGSGSASQASAASQNAAKPQGASETMQEGAQPVRDDFRAKCDAISDKFLLSRRESEVLYLLARGHNASYIQDKLCVAQSTTKTHIYHIYQKLGIHTQQELISMVNEDFAE